MGRTTDLRREIKRRFFPVMADKGFALDMRDAPFFVRFRRTIPGAVHVCDIQWEKYGRPRFVINFGKCAPAGVICHGQPIRPDDVTASATPLRGRLAPGGHSTVGGWFRQDRPLIECILHISRLRPPAEVITTLLGLFHEVEEWWEDGSVGPHVVSSQCVIRATSRRIDQQQVIDFCGVSRPGVHAAHEGRLVAHLCQLGCCTKRVG